MSSPSVSLSSTQLSANLQEIYSALDSNGNFTCQLVGDGTRVYNAKTSFGYLWRAYYAIPNLIGADAFFSDSLVNALDANQRAFKEQFQLIQKVAAVYKDYILKRTLGDAEGDMRKVRDQLTEWNQGVTPFLNLLSEKPGEKVERLFWGVFDRSHELSTKEKLYAYFEGEAFKQISGYGLLIELEGQTQGPLPFGAFFHISTGVPLSRVELQEITKWISKLNGAQGTSIEKLLKALALLITHFIPLRGALEIPRRVLLEDYLSQNGCALLKDADKKHIEWREALKKGDTLPGSKVVIGEGIGRKKVNNDNVLFHIEGENCFVVRIAKNCSVFGLESIRPIPPVEGFEMCVVREVCLEGCYALVEKLFPLIDKKLFKAVGLNLSVEQKAALDPVIKLIDQFVSKNFCVAELSLHYLMFDAQKRIKSTRALTKTEFEFHQLENFIFDLVPGCMQVYSYVMQQSKMHAQPIAQYYRRLFIHAVQHGPSDMASIQSGQPAPLQQRSAVFCSEVHSLKLSCCRALEQKLDIDELSHEKEDRLNTELIALYQASGAASKLWPTLQSETLQKLEAQ